MTNANSKRPLIASGITLGIGLGGFLDGIVFHQLLQFHNMLSAKYPPTNVVNLEINMFWDGLFHSACWVITVLGVIMLWRVAQLAPQTLQTRVLVGSMLAGWGLFNLVEGIIDHHILHLHHAVEGANHLVWDLGFLASGVVLVGIGYFLGSSRRSEMFLSRSAAPVR